MMEMEFIKHSLLDNECITRYKRQPELLAIIKKDFN